ncbi:MAG: caspase family protein [Bacteroidota bacterium]
MKKVFILLFFCSAVILQAQVKFKVGSIGKEEHGATGPADLVAQLSFKDENGNGILENRERATVTVKITNKGIGNAEQIKVALTEDSDNPDRYIYVDKPKTIDVIPPKKSSTVIFNIVAGKNVKTAVRKFAITGLEKNQYDMEIAYLELSIQEFDPPKLNFSGLEIVERGDGLYSKRYDGLLEKGEKIQVKLTVQNIGVSKANNVKYAVTTNSPNVLLEKNEGEIGDVRSGELKELTFILSPTPRFTGTGDLPVFLTLEDADKDGVLSNFQLPIQLDQKPAEPKILAVEAKQTQQRSVTVIKTGPKNTSGDFVDINDVTPSKTRNPNAVAVVIGIENYNRIPSAPYAAHDAQLMKRYFENSFGIDPGRILYFTNNDVSGIFFKKMFDPEKGELRDMIGSKSQETDIYVFYSGHGIPNKSADQTFLFPSDGDIRFLEDYGYPITTFYENLNKLNTRSVTVILDACFSGASRGSGMYKQENLIAAKGIKLKVTKPWTAYKNFTVINSSSGEETSLGNDQTETGLFTYYFAAGIRGEADKNKNGEVTLGELKSYVEENMIPHSRRISGTQTPEFYGDLNRVLVKY